MVVHDKPLRPLRIGRTGRDRSPDQPVPAVPDHVPDGAMAPDWGGPTLDNGTGVPRADLHVALLAPDRDTADIWRARARLIRPPLWWAGEVHLHVIVQDPNKGDAFLLQAMVDLGLIDATQAGLVGYPEARS